MTTKGITRREIVLIVLFLSILHFQRMETINRSIVVANKNDDAIVANHNSTTWHRNSNKTTAMCSIVINEELYLDEFVDYHRALGFDHFIFYDNSDMSELEQWGKLKGNDIWVFPFPGVNRQSEAYNHCAQVVAKEANGPFEWVAFFDVDEYLVLRQHDHIADMLEQYCSSGALMVNWVMFGSDGWNLPTREPVTRRFLYREATVNQHVKTIVRVKDIAETKLNWDPHNFVELKNHSSGIFHHDSNGNPVEGPFNENGPMDVVVLHHYGHKSHKEYLWKRSRGRVSLGHDETYAQTKKQDVHEALGNFLRSSHAVPRNNDAISGKVFDDSAWKFLKEKVPAYALFDEIGLLPASQ